MKLGLIFTSLALTMMPVTVCASTKGVRAQAAALLSRCLASPDGPFPADARIVPTPPGLAWTDRIVVAETPAGGNSLFAYRGEGAALTCGIALYGRVDARTQTALVSLLDRQPGWLRGEPRNHPWLASRPVRQVGWIDARAPGLAGALMAVRAPGASAPTLDIAIYHTLVR